MIPFANIALNFKSWIECYTPTNALSIQ